MARPRIYEEPQVQIRVRLPKSLYDRMQQHAADSGLSLNRLMARIAEAHDRARAAETATWKWRE